MERAGQPTQNTAAQGAWHPGANNGKAGYLDPAMALITHRLKLIVADRNDDRYRCLPSNRGQIAGFSAM